MRTATEARELKVHEPAKVRRPPLQEPSQGPTAIIFKNGKIENVANGDVCLDYEMRGS